MSDAAKKNAMAQDAALKHFQEQLRRQDKKISDLEHLIHTINQDLQNFKQKEIAALVNKVGHGPTVRE